jgi:hypothetical protein
LSRGSHLFGQLWQPGTILAIFFCIFIGSFMIGIRAFGSGSVQIGVRLWRSGWDVMVGVGQLVCIRQQELLWILETWIMKDVPSGYLT